jgi:HSP20 family protein
MVERSHTAGWLPQGYAQAYVPPGYAPASRASERGGDWFAPKADAGMAEEGYEITLELPGVAPEQVQITIQDGAVTVQGEKHVGREEGGWAYFFSEREFGAFQRSFRLPPDAAGERIDAVLRHGILTIRIPRVPPTASDNRRVPIRTG